MSVFIPTSLFYLITVLGAVLIIFLLGYYAIKFQIAKVILWAMLVLSVAFISVFLIDEHPGFRMISLISVSLTSMKVLVARNYPKAYFNWRAWTLFFFTTVGMNPKIFLEKKPKIRDGYRLIKFGLSRIFFGSVIIALLHVLPFYNYYLFALLALIGLSLIFHFGLLNINIGVLILLGYAAYPIFKQPMKSKSLQEFWGRRWNLAFSEMTAVVSYRPLIPKVGMQAALLISFLLSGMLHEIAISFSVMAGYGLPMVYFALHAFAMLLERNFFKTKRPGIIWVLAWLTIPMPLLFHSTFVKKIIFPLVGISPF